MFHQINMTGRLTADPEMRYTPSGDPVCSFRMAIDDGYTDRQSGNWVNRTLFVRVSVWGKRAETVNNNERKGDVVQIIGKLSGNWENGTNGELVSFGPKIWQTSSGENAASYDITAQQVIFVAKGPNHGSAPATGGSQQQVPSQPDDDDIPF